MTNNCEKKIYFLQCIILGNPGMTRSVTLQCNGMGHAWVTEDDNACDSSSFLLHSQDIIYTIQQASYFIHNTWLYTYKQIYPNYQDLSY